MRFTKAAIVAILSIGLAGIILAVATRSPQPAIYVPIIAIGLALALQKYIASFFAYFVITFSGIYDIGDRIRIDKVKGDVRRVGFLHTTLEEVGEDEKLGGELTGRILHVPNLIILDQPVLNYSKDYSVQHKPISSDFMFDEVRIAITTDSNVQRACDLLDGILKSLDETYMREAREIFRDGYPRFLDEATTGPRVLVYVEPKHIWVKGKFVVPVRDRNSLRSQILLRFFEEIKASPDIKLA